MLDPVAALREAAYWMERAGANSYRIKALRRAAATIAGLRPAELQEHLGAGSWAQLPGIGPRSALIISQAIERRVPDYLARLRASRRPLAAGGDALRKALRGDLHTHTNWSDGWVPLEEMVTAAAQLGHEYVAITDHSPSLRVANGLSAERLGAQLDVIAALQKRTLEVEVLTGIEVDILDDGRLDQSSAMLARLDVVVASVHSRLRLSAEQMTRRMVAAIADPHVNVLGHCTGRLVTGERGLRPRSAFDADVVFEACRVFGVAVEINARPERVDPPDDLLALAAEIGCLFAIDSDAHAPGQLEFLDYGAARAESAGIDADRIVTTWPATRVIEWTRAGRG